MKRLLKITAMTGLLTLLKMVMGFVIAKVVAIYTGPSGMAMLGQVQSMVTSLNGIVSAPVGTGVVRYTAEKYNKGYESCAPWWRASLQWLILILAVVLPIGLLVSEQLSIWLFKDPAYNWIIQVTVIALPITAIGTLCNSVINGQQNYKRYVVLGMLSAVVSSITMIGMIIYSNIQGALFAAAVQSALIGVIMLVMCLKQPWFKLSYWWGKTDTTAGKAIGGYVLMAITSALTVPISLILIRNILVSQVGWQEAGHWQAVWKISEVYLSVITMALGTYYLPRLSSLTGADAIIKEINNTVKIIIPIISIMALIIYLLRDVAIWILFTDEFKSARNLFAIQLCGDVIKIASWLYAYPMLSNGRFKWFVSTEIIFSLLFVVISYFLINSYGVQGANMAYLINYSCYLLFIRCFIRRIV
ncbi:O-antigen translocase [Vibrio sp. S11_S32]|uniref:O-antigen translocase n=1 Tax=Vibrio sp. S11_S32 TaxID=2720225 RepID=UPI0016810D24|nr:O-antigen translocase [Vibrio sp. S11_S32]MBD1577793.1 O-antigen translocase [Vibrio sp. S11_S32]